MVGGFRFGRNIHADQTEATSWLEQDVVQLALWFPGRVCQKFLRSLRDFETPFQNLEYSTIGRGIQIPGNDDWCGEIFSKKSAQLFRLLFTKRGIVCGADAS